MDFLEPLCEGYEEELFLLEVLQEVLPKNGDLVDRVGSILVVDCNLFAATVDELSDDLRTVLSSCCVVDDSVVH